MNEHKKAKFRSGKFKGHLIEDIKKSHPWYITWVKENRPEMLRVKILPPTEEEEEQMRLESHRIVKELKELFTIEGILDLIEVEDDHFKITVLADKIKNYRDQDYVCESRISDFNKLDNPNKECFGFLPVANESWVEKLELGEIIVLKGRKKDDELPIISDIGKFVDHYIDANSKTSSTYRSLSNNSVFEF